MIYFFNSLGTCIQKMSLNGDAVELQATAVRHVRAMDGIDCQHYATIPDDVPMENICWHDGRAMRRIPNPSILSSAARIVTLSNLPQPCDIVINGTAYASTDATATIDLTFAGTYQIVVQAIPYLDAVFLLTVA